ncbi:lantibiotic dehydratase [Streptomyces sp. PU-14G]|uniref:lantibiotic dehydratase n=1 Tax=Streptomyces sp. PU-14G TaxID=2800808 RepID=UPI0034DF58D6
MPPRQQHTDPAPAPHGTRRSPQDAVAGAASPTGAPTHDGGSALLGAAALLRSAGVTGAVWAGAGSPAVFAQADQLADRQARLAARARALSVRIGEEVVPDEGLATTDRRAVLALRRRLHAGDAPATGNAEGGAGLGSHPLDPARRTADDALIDRIAVLRPALGRDLRALAADAAGLRAAYGGFGRAVATERDRVSAMLLEAARSHPVLRSFVEGAAPRVVPDLERRAAAGEPWESKRQRKGVGYLWRALGRAAAKTTPRDWAGQLAVVPVSGRPAPAARRRPPTGGNPAGHPHAAHPLTDSLTGPPAAGAPSLSAPLNGPAASLLPELAPGPQLVAARRTENVHRLWCRLRDVDLAAAEPHVLLAPAPLHHATGEPGTGHLHFAVVDPDPAGGGRLRRLSLRRTPALEAVLRLLASTPRTVGALEAALGPPSSQPALRGFLAHLHTLGILQVCAAPRARRLPWTEHGSGRPVPLAGDMARGSFLDSYRRLTGTRREATDSGPEATVSGPEATVSGPETADSGPEAVGSRAEAPDAAGSRAEAPDAAGSRAEAPDAVGCRAEAPDAAGSRAEVRDAAGSRAEVPDAAVRVVADGLALARRVAELCEANRRQGEQHQGAAEAAGLGAEPVSVVRLMEAGHADDRSAAPRPRGRYACWEPAHTSDSGYARLLAYLGARLDEEQVDLDAALLDALGAPPVPAVLEAWPVDCLLRPLPRARSGDPGDSGGTGGTGGTGELGGHHGPGAPASPDPVAVLESASPAGVLDARFAEALGELYGVGPAAGYPNPAAYRDFLAAFERRAGVRFVEVLVPPLTEAAANAVRRPVATSWCTGDPNTPLYYGTSSDPGPADDGLLDTATDATATDATATGSAATDFAAVDGVGAVRGDRTATGATPLPSVRHLPLDRVTLRIAGGELVAEADGVRVLPVHHATRTPAPPYDRLLPLLTGAGHPAARRMVRLDGLAGAFPRAGRVPRLTVGGLLVVSPAQWRIARTALWHPTDSEADKVVALAALRRAAGLPRFGYLRARPDTKPLPVDLAALPALQAVERLCQAEPGTDLVFEEALPAPDEPLGQGTAQAPVAGGAFGAASQLLIRLPHDRTAEHLAARAHAAWCGAHDLPGVPPSSNGGGTPGRTPHPQ